MRTERGTDEEIRENLRARLWKAHARGESWRALERRYGATHDTLRRFALGQTRQLSHTTLWAITAHITKRTGGS